MAKRTQPQNGPLFASRLQAEDTTKGRLVVMTERPGGPQAAQMGATHLLSGTLKPVNKWVCKMNVAIRGIDGNIGPHNADTFYNDLHRDLKADFILANPPFNISDWGGDRLGEDARWKYGVPPKG